MKEKIIKSHAVTAVQPQNAKTWMAVTGNVKDVAENTGQYAHIKGFSY